MRADDACCDTVASTIRPDSYPKTAADLQPLWLLMGGLVLLGFCLCISFWLFPPDIGVGVPTIQYESDRFVVTAQIVNRTIHPVAVNLRFKIVPASAGIRGEIRGRPFAVKDVAIVLPGTAATMARCEFLRTASLPQVPAAEVQILSR